MKGSDTETASEELNTEHEARKEMRQDLSHMSFAGVIVCSENKLYPNETFQKWPETPVSFPEFESMKNQNQSSNSEFGILTKPLESRPTNVIVFNGKQPSLKLGYFNFHELAETLKLALPENQWRINIERTQMNIARLGSHGQASFTVQLSYPSTIDIYFHKTRLPKEHIIWREVKDMKCIGQQIRIVYILQLLQVIDRIHNSSSLKSDGETNKCKQFLMIGERLRQDVLALAYLDESYHDDTTGPKHKKNERSPGMETRAASRRREMLFLEKYWQDITQLYSAKTSFETHSTFICRKFNDRFTLLRKIIERWEGIAKDNPTIFPTIMPENFIAKTNDAKNEEGLRKALDECIKKVQLIRQTLQFYCPYLAEALSEDNQ